MQERRDERSKLVTELVQGIRTVKLEGWEERYGDLISQAREAEMHELVAFPLWIEWLYESYSTGCDAVPIRSQHLRWNFAGAGGAGGDFQLVYSGPRQGTDTINRLYGTCME